MQCKVVKVDVRELPLLPFFLSYTITVVGVQQRKSTCAVHPWFVPHRLPLASSNPHCSSKSSYLPCRPSHHLLPLPSFSRLRILYKWMCRQARCYRPDGMSSNGSVPEDGGSSGGMSSPPPSPGTLDYLNDHLENAGLFGGGDDNGSSATSTAAATAATFSGVQIAAPTHSLLRAAAAAAAAATPSSSTSTPLKGAMNSTALISSPQINTSTISADFNHPYSGESNGLMSLYSFATFPPLP